MIQNFDVKGGPDLGRENLPKLRAEMKQQGLAGFLIPHEDEYQNEYLPACNERLMWASGFTGSAGAAAVIGDRAAIFVDGRYTLQLASQVDADLLEYHRIENSGQENWLIETVGAGDIIGYDPRLHTPAALKRLETAISKAGGKLQATPVNPIDKAWTDRPAPPVTQVSVQPIEYAGQSAADKRARIGAIIKDQDADSAVITAPASIAWLLNIRGNDVMCTPLVLSTAIIDSHGHVRLFINPDKINLDQDNHAIRRHLGENVSLHTESELETALTELSDQTVIVDPNISAVWFADTLTLAGAKVRFANDPIALPKAAKNDVEIAATIQAHKRDGAALVNFLHWLDTEAQSGEQTEISAAQKLESFRQDTGELRDLSFETISGAGANGAIVHYRASTASSAALAKGSLFLVDSGGQYLDGTTDVTRTVPIGKPSAEMRQHFTLVLKGHIALATIRFPQGTSGHQLDVLARAALWNHGLDYDHGTGHGVGVFLGVHEGPQRIAKTPNSVALQPGMIVSNEPGFYKTGAYGIRIENLQYVSKPSAIAGGDREMLGFKTLTLAPLHRDLIDGALLSTEEKAYVDSYHARVWAEINPLVEKSAKEWLKKSCEPINDVKT